MNTDERYILVTKQLQRLNYRLNARHLSRKGRRITDVFEVWSQLLGDMCIVHVAFDGDNARCAVKVFRQAAPPEEIT